MADNARARIFSPSMQDNNAQKQNCHFVAVIDNRGKLLLGQSSTKDCATYKRGVEAIKSSSPHDALSFSGPKNEAYQFFNICIVPLINLSANADRDAEVIPLYDMISPVNKFVTPELCH